MEQTTADISFLESAIRQVFTIVETYGWQVMAIIGAPYLSWRIVQWFKLAYKRVYHRKPHWLALDIGSFVLVFVFSLTSWRMYSDDTDTGLFIAVVVSFCHTAIVKALFAYAPKKVVETLQYGVPDDQTVLATVLLGRDARYKERKAAEDDQTRLLTDDERREITGRNA